MAVALLQSKCEMKKAIGRAARIFLLVIDLLHYRSADHAQIKLQPQRRICIPATLTKQTFRDSAR
jgi:UDP-N-acetylglucosamine pyrophosphorylase